MSNMETHSRLTVGPFIAGTREEWIRTLRETALITSWCFKTAIMVSLAAKNEDHHVPGAHYKSLYERGVPPSGVQVWIARLRLPAAGHAKVAASRPQRLDYTTAAGAISERHGYRNLVSLGRFVFQVLYDPFGGSMRPVGGGEQAFIEVWPLPVEVQRWPPARSLTDAEFEGLPEGRIFTS